MTAGTNPENKNPYAQAPYLPHSGILGRCIGILSCTQLKRLYGAFSVSRKPPVLYPL